MAVMMAASVLMLSACAQSGTDKETEPAETVVQESETAETETETAETGEAETETDTENEAAEPEQEPPVPLTVELSAFYEGEWDDKGAIITADSATLRVLNDGYEELKQSLDEYNDKNWQEVYDIYLENREFAKQNQFSAGTELYISREIEVTRADNKILSFVNYENSYLGGAHGGYYANAEVFDAETGKALNLEDVVTDLDAVHAYTLDQLEANYEQSMFFEEYEEWIYEMFFEPDGAMASPLEWNMTTEGIQIRFSPYVIGPWASGTFEVELPYEGHEDLFLEEYVMQEDRLIRSYDCGEEISVDVDGDGENEQIVLDAAADKEEFITHILLREVTAPGEKEDDASTEAEEKDEAVECRFEFYGTLKDVFQIETEDGDPYLYLEFLQDNDYQMIKILKLSGTRDSETGKLTFADADEMYAGFVPAASYGHFIYDADQFALFSRVDALGTYTGYRNYHIGKDGKPAAEEDSYRLVTSGNEWSRSLTTKREIKVLDPEAEGEDAEVKLPKGSVLTPLCTDGRTMMEVMAEDGSVYEIPLEKEDYIFYINGISEYDCFETVPYAG